MTVTELHTKIDDEGRDLRTEAWLESLHVQYRFEPDLSLVEVDQEASLANQARLHALDPDVVERYTADMARGDLFPPVIAMVRRRRKLQLLGGNHRFTGAVKAKRPTIAAYVVTVEPELATRLMYEDNRRHGFPPSDEERIAQAIHLVDTGWTTKAAAECVGISEGRVANSQAAARADRRARLLAVAGFESLPKTTKARLDGIHSDPGFAGASKLVLAAGLNNEPMQALVTRLNKARSESDVMTIIAAETVTLREQIQRKAGVGRERTPTTARTRMITGVGHMAGVDPGEVAGACANAEQAKSLARQLVDVRKRIDDTLRELKARW